MFNVRINYTLCFIGKICFYSLVTKYRDKDNQKNNKKRVRFLFLFH